MNVEQVFELVDSLEETIEEMSPKTRDAGAAFFESALSTARGIAETVEKTERVTSGQEKALQNIASGIERWADNDHDKE